VPRSRRRLGSVRRSGLGTAMVMAHIEGARPHGGSSKSRVCSSKVVDQNVVVLFHGGGLDRWFSVTRRWLSGRAPNSMVGRWWWLQHCRSSLHALPRSRSGPHHHPRHQSRTSAVPCSVTDAFLCSICFFPRDCY
jgi:hypothetical protein